MRVPIRAIIEFYGNDDSVQEMFRICWRAKTCSESTRPFLEEPLVSTRGEIKSMVAELKADHPRVEIWYETGPFVGVFENTSKKTSIDQNFREEKNKN